MKNYIKSKVKCIIGLLFSSNIFRVNKKKIVFDNFNGKGYGCNPKYIAEEIIRQNLDWDLVWLVNDLNTPMPKQIKKVKYGSIKAMKEWATAKVWIDNVRNSKGVKKKKNQFYIQTWHGSLGMKKIEKEAEDILSHRYVKDAKYDGKITDLMFTDNSIQENTFKNYFWYDGTVLTNGIPRNDILCNVTTEVKEKVYQYFNIKSDKKMAIYAPTFRNEINMDDFLFNFHKCCKVLSQKFDSEFVMLIRLHPNVAKYGELLQYDDVVLNANYYPDIQELLAVCDVGITDYSSINFDMSRVYKPVFMICKDLDEYMKKERKFIMSLDKLPFSISRTEDELFDNILNFSKKEYEKDISKFFNKIKLVNSTHASKDIVELLKEKIY